VAKDQKTFAKIFYFLACLIATSLPVTVTMIWINKLKKNGKRKNATIAVSTSDAIAEQVA
jgi:hypothetical protein